MDFRTENPALNWLPPAEAARARRDFLEHVARFVAVERRERQAECRALAIVESEVA